MLYYSPFSASRINDLKKDWVQRVGEECAAQDVPYFLELVAYHDEMGEKGREFAVLKPEVVTRGIEEFSKPQYRVDVLKVGVPVNMAFVGTRDGQIFQVYCAAARRGKTVSQFLPPAAFLLLRNGWQARA